MVFGGQPPNGSASSRFRTVKCYPPGRTSAAQPFAFIVVMAAVQLTCCYLSSQHGRVWGRRGGQRERERVAPVDIDDHVRHVLFVCEGMSKLAHLYTTFPLVFVSLYACFRLPISKGALQFGLMIECGV